MNKPFGFRRIFRCVNMTKGTITPMITSSQYMYVSNLGTVRSESIFLSVRSTNFITAYTPSIITHTRAISFNRSISNPRLNARLLMKDSKMIIPHPAAIAEV